MSSQISPKLPPSPTTSQPTQVVGAQPLTGSNDPTVKITTDVAAADSTAKTTNDVATVIVNKPPITPVLKKRKIIPFSQKLSECWKRIKSFFKQCWDSDATSYDTPKEGFVTEPVPMKRFDPFELWPMANKPAAVENTTKKSYSPPVVLDTPAKFRNELPSKLTDLAKALNSKKATANTGILSKPRPQPNITGANCYMNASLQALENCYLQYDLNCQQLIGQDLTMLPNETLKQFEKRVLHTWAPLEDSEDVDVTQLQEKVQALKTDLSQVNAPLERRTINRKIATLEDAIFQIENQSLADYNDRVIFKWSYLLILQAKKFGSSDQVETALSRHHNASFMLNVPYMKFSERNAQLDASLYYMLWHERLGLGINQSSSREAKKADGEIFLSDYVNLDRFAPIKISLRTQGVSVGSVVEAIENHFSEQFQNSSTKLKLETDLTSKQKELKDAYNPFKVLDLEKEIKKIKKEQEDLGYWKPEDNLTFDDWTSNKLLTESPPQFLQIALDRFYADISSDQSTQKKIRDLIPFDTNSNAKFTDPYDLSKYFAPEVLPEGGAKYELIGISQHRGSGIGGGHYVAYVKRGQEWFCANDSSISSVDVKNVPFDDCSVLSYRRL